MILSGSGTYRRLVGIFNELTTDYLGVKALVEETRNRRGRGGLHVAPVDYPKPYTMVASYLLNRLGADYSTRVACCSVVELLLKPLPIMDDLGENWKKVKQQLEWSKNLNMDGSPSDSINYEYLYLNPLVNSLTGILIASEHEEAGLLQRGDASRIKSVFVEKAQGVIQGFEWQQCNRLKSTEEIVTGSHFPSIDDVYTFYVERIAGDLFYLVPSIVGFYVSDKLAITTKVSELMYPFANLFQTQDDRADLHEDIRELYVTTNSGTILNHGSSKERTLLRKLAQSPLSQESREIHKHFPSLKMLEPKIQEDKRRLLEGLSNLGWPEISRDLEVFDKHYDRIRLMAHNLISS